MAPFLNQDLISGPTHVRIIDEEVQSMPKESL
jgi:hypothetical protein